MKLNQIQLKSKKRYYKEGGKTLDVNHIDIQKPQTDSNLNPLKYSRTFDSRKKAHGGQNAASTRRHRPTDILTKNLELRKRQNSHISYTPKEVLASPQARELNEQLR